MRSPGAVDCAPRTSPSLNATERSAPPDATVRTPERCDWWMNATKSPMGKPERSPARMQRGCADVPPAAGVRRATSEIRRGGEEQEPAGAIRQRAARVVGVRDEPAVRVEVEDERHPVIR